MHEPSRVLEKCPLFCMWVYGCQAPYRVTVGSVGVEKAVEGEPRVVIRKVCGR